jgi:hypothetical protein
VPLNELWVKRRSNTNSITQLNQFEAGKFCFKQQNKTLLLNFFEREYSQINTPTAPVYNMAINISEGIFI